MSAQWSGTVAIIVCSVVVRSIILSAVSTQWSGADPVEWHGCHYNVFDCILFYSIVYCAHPVEWSGAVAIIVLTQWSGTVAIIVC